MSPIDFNEKITFMKKDVNHIIAGIDAKIDGKIIYIGDVKLHIQEGDIIERGPACGFTERFCVIDFDFYKGTQEEPGYYAIQVKRLWT